MSHRQIPTDLRALADEMSTAANSTEDVGTRLLEVGTGVAWESTAADRFREEVRERALATETTAALVRDVEAALRAQADSVEERIAMIDDAREWVADRVDDARSLLGDVWDGVVDAVSTGVSEAREILDVTSYAPSDDLDPGWLDTARRLGR